MTAAANYTFHARIAIVNYNIVLRSPQQAGP